VCKSALLHSKVDKTLEEANIDGYDALVLPGGAVNADHLRMQPKAREWARQILDSGKPLAAICHAPWLLVSAGVAKGKHIASYFTIQDDIRNAGGEWVDEPVVVDGNLITSRQPSDIPDFSREVIAMLS
jgi:protease I